MALLRYGRIPLPKLVNVTPKDELIRRVFAYELRVLRRAEDEKPFRESQKGLFFTASMFNRSEDRCLAPPSEWYLARIER